MSTCLVFLFVQKQIFFKQLTILQKKLIFLISSTLKNFKKLKINKTLFGSSVFVFDVKNNARANVEVR